MTFPATQEYFSVTSDQRVHRKNRPGAGGERFRIPPGLSYDVCAQITLRFRVTS